jgi:D-3-phosphoglycerate dehydrogenase
MARPKILFTLPTVESGRKLLEPVADLVVAPDPSAATLYRMVGDADALVVRTQLPADLLDRPHRLLGIVRHGTGLDLIPVEAATAQGIPVANVPGVNAETVAEYCIGAFLTLARRMHRMDRELREIGWNESRKHADFAIELFGRTLGVVGVGDIGRRVAEIGHSAFSMRILGYQRRLDALPGFVEPVDIDRLLRDSDFISLNCPLTPETRHLVNERRLRSMKPTAFLVNAARGPVIEEAALVRALEESWIGGAAIDVYDEQPLRRDHPFLRLRNVVLTPHAAGLTREASDRMSVGAAEQVLQLLAGERPKHLVNPEIWEQHLERQRRIGGGRS